MALGSGGGGGGQAGGIRAGAAYVELFVKGNISGALLDAERKFNAVGKRLMKTGGLLFGGGLAVGGSLLVGATETLTDLAKMNAAAKALGTTAEGASGLFGALKSIGGDFKEDLEGITQFTARIGEALAGTGEGVKLFEGLSVSAKELVGLPIEEKFYRVLAAIRQLPQEDQLAKLSLVGGTDSMKKWIELLAMSNVELRDRAAQFSMTKDDLDQATTSGKAYKSAIAGISMAWAQIVVGAAPAITFLADGINKILTPTIEWLKRNREIVTVFLAGAGALAATGAAIFAIGSAFSAVGAVIAAAGTIWVTFKATIAALLSPVALVIAGVTALGYVFFTQTEMGKRWADSIGNYFKQTLGTVQTAWGGIKKAIAGGDLELAFEVALAGLDVEWRRFMVVFRTEWNAVLGFFQDSWTDATATAKVVWRELVTAFKIGMLDLIEALPADFGKDFFGDFVSLSKLATGAVIGIHLAAFDAIAEGVKKLTKFIGEQFKFELEIGNALLKGDLDAAADAFVKLDQLKWGGNAVFLIEGGAKEAEQAKADFDKAAADLGKDLVTPDAGGLVGRDKFLKELADAKAAIRAEAEATKGLDAAEREARMAAANKKLEEARDLLAAVVGRAEGLGGAGAMALPPAMQAKMDQVNKAAGALGYWNLAGFASRALGDQRANANPVVKQMMEANAIAKKTLEVLEIIKGKASPLVFGG